MDFSPPRIFISYSRSDGRKSAEEFERRIKGDGLTAWRDMKSVEGGENIRHQVLRAIEEVEHFVLILSQGALDSDWVKREWKHARSTGTKISPILGTPELRTSKLPRWMQRVDVYGISEPERWAKLIAVLRGPGETLRVPYMKGHISDTFVPRPVEYCILRDAVLAKPQGDDRGATIALTAALVGAGGYGKTTLANALCRDDEVQAEFTDGIIRVEVGKERDDVRGLIVDVIEKLDLKGRRPGFEDVNVASEHLAELIGERRLLLVIDDVWREKQLRPFLLGGPSCVRLVTTRKPNLLPEGAQRVGVDEMRADEAAKLIAYNLSVDHHSVTQRLAGLARRFKGWAQMLEIANGWMRSRVRDGEPLLDAIERFEERLGGRGLEAFDPKEEVARNRAIRACLEASLEDLTEDENARLNELAILPEDEDVPLDVIEGLWSETAGLVRDAADDVYRRFHGLSLLQRLNLSECTRTLRLHDILIWYLGDRIGSEGLRAAHAAMARMLEKRAGGDWTALATGDVYCWRFGTRHLRGAGRDADADRLLLDYTWIRAKLAARGAQELLESYQPTPKDKAACRVGRAIALSTPTLAQDPQQLSLQLFGRLGEDRNKRIVALMVAARQSPEFRPSPRWPGLTPSSSAELLRITHEGIERAAFDPDGDRIVTASGWLLDVRRIFSDTAASHTARVWDANSGAEIAVLRGHDGHLRSAAFNANGDRIVTSSKDCTARIWDVESGAQIAVLRGHAGRVSSATFNANGDRILTRSDDCTARIWDAGSGVEITVLRGYEGPVSSATFNANGDRIVTASDDGTARIWDAGSGATIAVLRGHDGELRSAAFDPDGNRIVTASDDGTARIWDANSGAEIAVLRGHYDRVFSASFDPDGDRIVTSSQDGTARIWDAESRVELAVLDGHDDWVFRAIFNPGGDRIVTTSRNAWVRIWDAASSS